MKTTALISFALMLTFSFNSYGEVAIIVNKDNQNELSKAQIKRIFLNKIKSFSTGASITTAGLKSDDPVTAEFYDKVLGKSASQVKAYWSKILFTGTGTPPKEFKLSSDVINMVQTDVSAIAFVDASTVTDDVKVILKL